MHQAPGGQPPRPRPPVWPSFDAPLVAAAVVLVAATAFAFRFLTFRGLPNDHYMYLAWAQQVLAGDWPGRDFVEPGMPLAVLLSAAGQAAWPGPFGEGLLSIGLLAAAAAVACWVVADVTRSIGAGVLAAALQIALLPRLYSYPKVLVPAAALWLLARHARRPTRLTLVALAGCTVIGFLLRHDLGVTAALAISGGLLACGDDWRTRLRGVGAFALWGLVLVTPYLAYVQWAEGLPEHLHVALEFAKAEAHQFVLDLPPLPSLSMLLRRPAGADDAVNVLFWLFHLMLAGVVVLAVVKRRQRPIGPVLIATAILLIAYRIIIVRHPLSARMPDTAAVLGIGLAFCCAGMIGGLAGGRRRWRRAVGGATLSAVLLVVSGRAIWTLGRLADELDEAGVTRSWAAIVAQGRWVLDTGRSADWDAYWPAGEVPAVLAYLRDCTEPSQRILLTWPAPEYQFFARRPFAAGHAMFMHASFATDRDQDRMLAWLQGQDVPIVLYNESRRDEFDQPFPRLAAQLSATYTPRAMFTIRDGSEISIAVREGLHAGRAFGDGSWPCDFQERAPRP